MSTFITLLAVSSLLSSPAYALPRFLARRQDPVPVYVTDIVTYYTTVYGSPSEPTSSSSPAAAPTSSYPTFSVHSSHVQSSNSVPHGFTASGFIPYPTGATGTGLFSYPNGTDSAYHRPTATGKLVLEENVLATSIDTNVLYHHTHTRSSSYSSSQPSVPTLSSGFYSSYKASSTPTSSTPTYTSASTSASSPAAASATAVSNAGVLRGVNLGGWLVLEKWMNSDVFEGTDAVDQWTFDSTDGAADKLQDHWSSYITEDDIQTLASWGINAVRIPIGYWAYDNSGTPYIKGADAYLEKAIGWCRNAGITVLVDCHGSPGSQNGFDNSGHSGDVNWQSDDNLNRSITILETIAAKYGSAEYADVVFGIELVNEPISWDQNNFATTKQWAQDAYAAVKKAATNPSLNVIMHDGFMGPSNWEAVGSAVNGDSTLAQSQFWMDTHLYQNQVAADSELTQDQHIAKACNWSTSELLPSSSTLPVIVGEFSAATNICANPDGSTVAGNTCYVDGCQCSANVAIEDWNQPLIQATRKFVEAELDTFEAHARGWFMWSYKGPGGWALENQVKYGLIGNKVTDRKYPGQCN